MKKIVLIGPPGSGKGTQALRIVERYGMAHVSSGEVLRGEASAGTELGLRIREFMERGEIGPVELITEAILNYVDSRCAGGFVLDGFPRTLYQAEALAARHRLDAVIFIDMPEPEIVRRVTGRRICTACGTIYHEVTRPPLTAGACDSCKTPLTRRPDDNEETARTRIRVYNEETRPVLDYYHKQGLLHTVNGARDPDSVFADIAAVLS